MVASDALSISSVAKYQSPVFPNSFRFWIISVIDEWQIERDTHTQVNDDTGAKLVQNFPASARTKKPPEHGWMPPLSAN